MKKYELMAIFPLDGEKSAKGVADLKAALSNYGAEIEEEKVCGDRDLTYEIKKQKKGHHIEVEPFENQGT